ncbi:MAG TPA: hypothetical protein VFW07_24190 [Parafilimonas sp.]|nr:hypothetical protein [Parafilimonas sp.]
MATQNLGTKTTPPRKSRFKRFLTTLLIIIIIIGIGFFWWNYLFVFGEGVKSGQLNYVVKKGNLFKTYEGKLIQSGIRSQSAGSVQSYEFEFSIADDSLANILMNNSGNYYDLHYKEYKHALPWRGFSPFVVDKIIRMQPAEH